MTKGGAHVTHEIVRGFFRSGFWSHESVTLRIPPGKSRLPIFHARFLKTQIYDDVLIVNARHPRAAVWQCGHCGSRHMKVGANAVMVFLYFTRASLKVEQF
jgi:hypothetical protein